MKKFILYFLTFLIIGYVSGQERLLTDEELQLYPTYTKLLKVPVDSVYKITMENMGAVPDDFDKYVRLQKLCIFGNDWDYDLYNLPSYFYTFPNLTHLTISNTDVGALNPAIKNFTNLRVLNIANNQFMTLPKTMVSLENLKELVIDNNIDKIPAIPSLEDLSIYFETNIGDDSGAIPEGIADLGTLKRLYLNGENTLVNLSEMIGIIKGLPALKILSFMDPNLNESHIKALSGIKKIEELNLPSIEVSADVMSGFSHLKKLSFGKYLVNDPKQREKFWTTIIGFPKLEEVTTTFAISDTQYYRQLKKVNIVLNLDVPLDIQLAALKEMPSLFKLEFPRSSTIPRNLSELKTVRVVDATELYGIDPSVIFGYLMTIPSLEKILISNDQFTVFPPELVKMVRIKEIEIYNIQHGVFNAISDKEKARARKILPGCKFWYIENY